MVPCPPATLKLWDKLWDIYYIVPLKKFHICLSSNYPGPLIPVHIISTIHLCCKGAARDRVKAARLLVLQKLAELKKQPFATLSSTIVAKLWWLGFISPWNYELGCLSFLSQIFVVN